MKPVMKKIPTQHLVLCISFLLFGMSAFFLGRLSMYWDNQKQESSMHGVQLAAPAEVEHFIQELKKYDPKTNVEENEIDLYTKLQ
jgi:hypothetical protein